MKDAIDILSKTPPPKPFTASTVVKLGGTFNGMTARIFELETALGIPHTQNLKANPVQLYQRIADLEGQLVAKGISTTPLATLPTADKVETIAESIPFTAATWLKMSDGDRASFCRGGGELGAAEFARLNPQQKMNFVKAGGKCVDDPPANPVAATGTVITREHFEQMTPTIKMAYILNGGKLSE